MPCEMCHHRENWDKKNQSFLVNILIFSVCTPHMSVKDSHECTTLAHSLCIITPLQKNASVSDTCIVLLLFLLDGYVICNKIVYSFQDLCI